MESVAEALETLEVEMTVSGKAVRGTVPLRLPLVDFLREDLRLTGTHIGCEHRVCGASTILMDRRPVSPASCSRSRRMGPRSRRWRASPPNGLKPMQQSFRDYHGLECGFWFLMTLEGVDPDEYPEDSSIREMLSGNLCRYTGYQNIVAVVKAAWGRDGD